MLKIGPLCLAAALIAPLHTLAEPAQNAASVSVLPGWRTDRGTHIAALRIELADGWKTYWRAPGDAGIPPRFAWDGSENIASVAFHWPRPEVYTINGMRSIGYYGELVLPMEFTPRSPGEPIHVAADVEIGVCHDICMPMKVRIEADLPAGGNSDPAIQAALAAGPDTAGEAGVAGVDCDIAPIRDGLRLTARIDMPSLGPDEVTVFELPDQTIWVSEAEGHREGQDLVASSDLVPPSGQPFALDRSQVRITVLGKGRAVEMTGCSG